MHYLLQDAKFAVFSEEIAPEAHIFQGPKVRNFVCVVRNGDSNSPFVALCYQRGQEDWYHQYVQSYAFPFWI